MAAERDRLIKDRAMIQKQLQEKERQLEEVLHEVGSYIRHSYSECNLFTCYPL